MKLTTPQKTALLLATRHARICQGIGDTSLATLKALARRGLVSLEVKTHWQGQFTFQSTFATITEAGRKAIQAQR